MIQFTRNMAHKWLTSALAATISAASLAQTPSPSAPNRKSMADSHRMMADMHTKMATCLDSTKPLEECRQQMVESCSGSFGANCPMMGAKGAGGKGRGMMGGQRMGMMNHGPCMEWMMNPGSQAQSPEATPSK